MSKTTFDSVAKSFADFFLGEDLSKSISKREKELQSLIEKYNKSPVKPVHGTKLSIDDTIYVGKTALDKKGFAYHHISSFDDFVENGIKQIITQVFKINKDFTIVHDSEQIDRINVQVAFTDVKISKPKFNAFKKGITQPLMPNPALVNDKTYSASLYIDSTITATAYFKDGTTQVKSQSVKNKKICQMPVMVGTKICNTYKLSKEALLRSKEDPSDLGAYFIIKGVEWVIDSIENITYNQARIHKNIGYQREVARCEYISKPGDSYQNSDQIIIRLKDNNAITIEIRRDKLKEKHIPFFLLFKAMGWVREIDIYNSIVYDDKDEISKLMSSILKLSFISKYDMFDGGLNIHDQTDAIMLMATYLSEKGDQPLKYLAPMSKAENFHQAANLLNRYFDSYLFPHIGKTPGSRNKKLRMVGLLIRKMLLVHLDINKSTDRDSLKNKRIHPSGISYAKAFKTYFNASVVQGIIRKIKNDIKNYSFEKILLRNPMETHIFGQAFDKLIIQTITSGNKSQLKINRSRSITNRLSSQQLNRKNKLNAVSIIRQITTTNDNSSKSSDRAREMRYVHPTYAGYIDPAHSPEGEKVGINKQLAIYSFITNASKSCIIKELIKDFVVMLNCKDASEKCKIIEKSRPDDIFEYENITHVEISKYDLGYIYVNGDPVGFSKSPILVADKFRKIRRGPVSGFDSMVTIHWDEIEDACNFWTDPGRLIRPLIIVYNNQNDSEKFPKGNKFVQCTLLNNDIIDGLKRKMITLENLLDWGIIEYISAEEQENMYLCPDIDTLYLEQHNELKRYTHCDIPQSIMGISTLTSPYANHNQTPRLTFQANQVRQTCGYYSLNWPFRVDKDTFLQYNCEYPLIRTQANNRMPPNGYNAMVAIAIYGGYNQEDSVIASQGAIDRGVYNGCKFTFYKDTIDDGKEKFGVPDLSLTIHKNAGDYARLTKEGYIPKGSFITKGDIIIGKYAILPKDHDPHYKYLDKSTVYKAEEDAVVHNVIHDRNEEGKRFIKIILRKLRPVVIGDKFCLTPDHEVMTKYGWITLDNLYNLEHKPEICTLNKQTHYLEYHKPFVHSFDEQYIDMYSVDSKHVKCLSTLNHKMYVRNKNSKYSLEKAGEIASQNKYWLRRAHNNCYEKDKIAIHAIPECSHAHINYCVKLVDINEWLKFFGIYISMGHVTLDCSEIKIFTTPQRANIFIDELGLNLRRIKTSDKYQSYDNFQIAKYLQDFGSGKSRYLPTWVYDLDSEQSKSLVLSMLGEHIDEFRTISRKLAGCFQRLLIHCGWNGTITKNGGDYIVTVDTSYESLEPLVDVSSVKIIRKKTAVLCPEVRNNIFMVKYKGTCYFTGNSSRAGQKGIVAMTYTDSDMPITADTGVTPTLIINPHALPSRMTCGQIIESHTGNLAALKAMPIDGTIFRYNNIETISEELKKIGFKSDGYRRMINGETGEYMDTLIFMGPTAYQRLQKFVEDIVYAVSHGPTDATTRQPLDGKALHGGMRLGEMERDVLISHGAPRFLAEKFYSDSDGYNLYICANCGNYSIVNYRRNIYECKQCGDLADIHKINSSWSSKLLFHQLEACHIKPKFILDPPAFERYDLLEKDKK